jgi:hypothetical protein
MKKQDYIKKNTKSFKKNYKKDFNEEISDQEAYEGLFNAVGFIKTLEKIEKRVNLEKKLDAKYFEKSKKSDNI